MVSSMAGKKIYLTSFIDSDYTGDSDTAKSISRYTFFLGIGAILWFSKK